MTSEINYKTTRREYQSLRENIKSVQLATLGEDDQPEVSYAPFIWFEGACFLFLSQLARHTQNLLNNPAISLLIIEDQVESQNQFARRRIIWQGRAEVIGCNVELYKTVMQLFRDRFGDFIDIVEPLQDFRLFKICPHSGRFIRDFGQAFQLSGDDLNEITHINPDGTPPT